MKKYIIIIVSISVLLVIAFAYKTLSFKEVMLKDGTITKEKLKKEDIENLTIGETIYYEYEDRQFSSGTVIGKSGDQMQIKDDTILANNEVVLKDDKIRDLDSNSISPVACSTSGSENGTTVNQTLNNCVLVFTVTNNIPEVIPKSSPAEGDITNFPSDDTVYVKR